MEILLGVLASASFLEKVSLLVVGAALTGIIVPVVKFRMDQPGSSSRRYGSWARPGSRAREARKLSSCATW